LTFLLATGSIYGQFVVFYVLFLSFFRQTNVCWHCAVSS